MVFLLTIRYSPFTIRHHGEARVGLIQPQRVRGDDDGHLAREQRHRVAAICHGDIGYRLDLGVAEGIAQQFAHKVLGDSGRVQIGSLHLDGEVLPLGTGDLKGAAVFILELEPFRDGVIGLGLVLGDAERGFFQLVGEEQAAFEGERRQAEGAGGLADALHVGGRWVKIRDYPRD